MSGSLHLISVTIRTLMVVSRERIMHIDLESAQYMMKGARELKPYRSTADL